MVFEMAQLNVKSGMEAEFEKGVAAAKPLFERAKGCKGVSLQRSAENPQLYLLIVKWDTMENHTVDFRNSKDFQEWRRLVAHCFAGPATVHHTRDVWKGF